MSTQQLYWFSLLLAFCMPALAQTDEMTNSHNISFSPKEIKQLQKGDQLINQGKAIYQQVDSILIIYRDLEKRSQVKRHPLSNTEKDLIQNAIRALRVQYAGMKEKTDVYYRHLKAQPSSSSRDAELKNHKERTQIARQNYQKSRDIKQLNKALLRTAFAVDIHTDLQQTMLATIASIDNSTTPEQPLVASQPVQDAAIKETQKQQSVPEPTPEPAKPAPTTSQTPAQVPSPVVAPVVTETPAKVAESKVTPTKPPIGDTYYTIQIMADKSKATDEQLKRLYSGSLPIVMNEGDGWFRYSVGKFNAYSEAQSSMKAQAVKGYIVAYHGKKRISISEAKALLNK